MIETVTTITRPHFVRRNVSTAASLRTGNPMVLDPVPEAEMVFDHGPRTSMEDMLLLAEAAAEEQATPAEGIYTDTYTNMPDMAYDETDETPFLTEFMRSAHRTGEKLDGRA